MQACLLGRDRLHSSLHWINNVNVDLTTSNMEITHTDNFSVEDVCDGLCLGYVVNCYKTTKVTKRSLTVSETEVTEMSVLLTFLLTF